MQTDNRPICTKENPAPLPKSDRLYVRWDYKYQHPEAVGHCINEDHDDWKYECPHCGGCWIYEGPDA